MKPFEDDIKYFKREKRFALAKVIFNFIACCLILPCTFFLVSFFLHYYFASPFSLGFKVLVATILMFFIFIELITFGVVKNEFLESYRDYKETYK